MEPRKILLLNVLGVLLVTTWWLPHFTLWSSLDDAVFWYFNQFVSADYPRWTAVLAALNTRAFDQAMFALLVVMLYVAMRRDPHGGWIKWGAIGVVMTLSALIIQGVIHSFLPYSHASPTKLFSGANLLSELTTLPAKDSASSSFPSDHGLMAMIFAAFMWRFADRSTAWLSTALVVLVCAPRIMVGAHWASDVFIGALAIALLVLPWLLCTPLAERLVHALVAAAPRPSAIAAPRPEGSRSHSLVSSIMQLRKIALFNVIGLALLLSWLLPDGMLWTTLDDDIFWFFNQFITPHHMGWAELLAVLNMRIFDMVAFGLMAMLFIAAIVRDRRPDRLWRWLGIGVTMVVTAGVLALFTTKGIRYGHPSPTAFFENARHLTDIVSIPTKDSSSNSFPGDHGLMLMVFAAFMLRFGDRRVGWLSVAFVVVLSAPRIMVGAHWFSDVYMGSLTIALIALPWVLCTPLASRCVKAIASAAQRLRRPHA